jgi:hypothetical protein
VNIFKVFEVGFVVWKLNLRVMVGLVHAGIEKKGRLKRGSVFVDHEGGYAKRSFKGGRWIRNRVN